MKRLGRPSQVIHKSRTRRHAPIHASCDFRSFSYRGLWLRFRVWGMGLFYSLLFTRIWFSIIASMNTNRAFHVLLSVASIFRRKHDIFTLTISKMAMQTPLPPCLRTYERSRPDFDLTLAKSKPPRWKPFFQFSSISDITMDSIAWPHPKQIKKQEF